MSRKKDDNLYELRSPFNDPLRKILFSVVKRPISRLLCLKSINRIYNASRSQDMDESKPYYDRVLEVAKVQVNLDPDDIKKIPAKGPAILVSNHPFGIVDGLVLIKAVREARPDAMILANHMLYDVPELKEFIIPVDPFGTKESTKSNISGMKEALRHLKKGGLLGVFPAGEVASLRVRRRMVRDSVWASTIGGLARKTRAAVVPMFVKGKHGPLFHALGMVHPKLRTVMIPRVNIKRINSEIDVSIGTAIPADKMASFPSHEEATNYMRFRTYLLRRPHEKGVKKASVSTPQPIAEPIAKEQLMEEISALSEQNVLIENDQYMVFEAGASRIPGLMHEIGRLREETFRPVGEGTGLPLDTDRFDLTYRHLVLWNKKEQEIAGAYRFGKTDEIIARQGVKGLYSNTLFKFKPGFEKHIQPGLEFGRSFILKKYQRSYQPLLLLWKGIGEYIYRHPRYNILFGCVSVSSDYNVVSRELMVRFLEKHKAVPEIANMVKPKRPPKIKFVKRMDISLPETAFDDFEDIGVLVGAIEEDKSIPILLKQYLKLGGKVLAFNIDPDFGNCMDGLILVDIRHTKKRMVEKFLGAEKASEFFDYHGITQKDAS